MKKSILFFLVTCVTSISINQLINSNVKTYDEINLESKLNENKNESLISNLEHEYSTRSNETNNAIKNNLIASITLVNNEIIINYQNLNLELYSENIYQIILSSDYLNTLKTQYQLEIVHFDANNHINFDSPKISNYSANVWGEWHWYWFSYWKLHLSYNAVTTIISYASKLGGVSGPLAAKISEFIAGILSSGVAFGIAVVVAAFIIISFWVLLGYSNNINGCWLGILTLLPGVNWGSN